MILSIVFFVTELQNMDVNGMWFQKDSVTCNTARETIQVLREIFPGFVISHFDD